MNQFPPPSTAPAGWYPDPHGGALLYFDGRVWADRQPEVADRVEHPNLPFSVALGALGVLVFSLLASKLVVDSIVEYGLPLPVLVFVAAVLGYGPSLVWAWYVRRRWGAGSMSALGWKFRWSDLGWGPLTWVAAIGAQIVMAAVVLTFDIPLSGNVDSISDQDIDRSYLIATGVAAVVAAPIIEEVVFRGLILRGFLSRMGPVLAVLIQGVLFGLAHVDPVRGSGNLGLVMVLTAVGVVFGGAAYLFRRLGPSVIAHGIFNGAVLAIVLSGVLDGIETDVGGTLGWLQAVVSLL